MAGCTSSTILKIAGQRYRSSASPFRDPATEYGWQGAPAMMQSTLPRRARPSNVVTSVQIGAVSRMPASIASTRKPIAGASLSTKQIVRALGIAIRTARSRPPKPAKREITLKVSATLVAAFSAVRGLVVDVTCIGFGGPGLIGFDLAQTEKAKAGLHVVTHG